MHWTTYVIWFDWHQYITRTLYSIKLTENTSNSASKLRLLAFNARSIGKNPKRANVLNFLKKKDPDIIIITETNIGKNIETTIRDEWDGKVLFSSFDAQSRGVCAFIEEEKTFTGEKILWYIYFTLFYLVLYRINSFCYKA